MSLLALFDDFEKRVRKDFLAGAGKEKSLVRLSRLRSSYEALKARPEGLDEEGGVAAGLIEKGRKILAKPPLKPEGLEAFRRYAAAARYDLSGELWPYTWYVRCFFAATIGFYVLAPQFFPAIMALIFVLPTFLGLRGLKSRSVNGFTMSAMVFPLALLAGSTAARSFIGGLFDLAAFSSQLGVQFGVDPGIASVFVFIFSGLSLLTIVSSIAGAVIGFLHKDMFV